MIATSDRTGLAERLGIADKALIRLPKAAEAMSIPRTTLYQWVRDGQFPVRRLPNGRLRIAVDDVLDFIEGKPASPSLPDAA